MRSSHNPRNKWCVPHHLMIAYSSATVLLNDALWCPWMPSPLSVLDLTCYLLSILQLCIQLDLSVRMYLHCAWRKQPVFKLCARVSLCCQIIRFTGLSLTALTGLLNVITSRTNGAVAAYAALENRYAMRHCFRDWFQSHCPDVLRYYVCKVCVPCIVSPILCSPSMLMTSIYAMAWY